MCRWRRPLGRHDSLQGPCNEAPLQALEDLEGILNHILPDLLQPAERNGFAARHEVKTRA
jgi:hypothetical protein